MIGKIIASSVDKVYFRIEEGVDVEDVKVGGLVVIESKNKYLARVSDIASKNLGDSLLPDKIAAISHENILMNVESVYGPQMYYVVGCNILGILNKGLKGSKSIPKILSHVRKVEDRDLDFLNLGDNLVKIGKLRDMDIDVKIDVENFIVKHSGIFGKTGSGKSNTVKVILENLRGRYSCLVFDVHSEYGYNMGLGGLKNVSVVGLKGATCDVSLTIPISEITPSDISIITDLTTAQEEALDLIYRRKGKEWARYVVDLEVDDIVMDFGGQMGKTVYGGEIRSETISALKRRIRRVVGFDFVRDEFDSLNYIYDKVKRKETLVIDFGEYENNDWVIKLVTTIITRFLLNKFRGAKRRKIDIPKTLIVLEESHKLLNKDIAKKTIFERIVREGRKFGLGLCVVDQMPRKILDEVISQLNTVVIMLLTNLKDREHLISSSENDLSDFKEEMRRLDTGEAIVTGISVPIPIPAKIDFFKPSENEEEEDDFDWN